MFWDWSPATECTCSPRCAESNPWSLCLWGQGGQSSPKGRILSLKHLWAGEISCSAVRSAAASSNCEPAADRVPNSCIQRLTYSRSSTGLDTLIQRLCLMAAPVHPPHTHTHVSGWPLQIQTFNYKFIINLLKQHQDTSVLITCLPSALQLLPHWYKTNELTLAG